MYTQKSNSAGETRTLETEKKFGDSEEIVTSLRHKVKLDAWNVLKTSDKVREFHLKWKSFDF